MKTAVTAIAMSVLSIVSCSAAAAQDYPSKPIRMVVPFPAGGVVDYVARQVGQKVAETMGQPVVVENRPGASGALATEAVAGSPADGYTLLVVFDSHVVNPHMLKNIRYDIFKDFQSVSLLAQIPLALMTYPKFPAATVADLLKAAKTTSLLKLDFRRWIRVPGSGFWLLPEHRHRSSASLTKRWSMRCGIPASANF